MVLLGHPKAVLESFLPADIFLDTGGSRTATDVINYQLVIILSSTRQNHKRIYKLHPL